MSIAEVTPTIKHADLSEERQAHVCHRWFLADESNLTDVALRYTEDLCISVADEPNRLALKRDPELDPEEYTITIEPGTIDVTASTRAGFLHALATINQLRDGPTLPTGYISDRPRLEVRGLQLMFESVKQLRFDDAMALLQCAARHKLNTVLMEFGDRFPFEGEHKVVASSAALTRSQVRQLASRAQDLGIRIIPLLQSLGHLGYLLKHDQYAAVREEDEVRHQLCPLNEQSLQVWTELAEQVLELIPRCGVMHIGGDETRQLGVCPRCAQAEREMGKGGLYTTHINKVCDWLSDRGITPIIWDDILCAHPSTIERLHEAAEVMYWDYWTTCDPSPLLVARGNSPVVVYDRRWEGEWAGELSEVTARTLQRFARPIDMEHDLSSEYLAAYRQYLGDQFPKAVRAMPYLEYFLDRGRRVYGAPTCSGNHSNWYTLPDLPRHGENIKTCADRCIEAEAAGMITTAWYNRSPEFLHWGILTTAEFTW